MAHRVPLLLAVLAATLAATGAEQAGACSCVDADPRDRVEAGDPAVVGRVVSKTPSEGEGPFAQSRYVVRVEHALNARLGEEVVVFGGDQEPSCGFGWRVGQRVGAFLQRTRGGWTTNLCSLASPGELERALRPYPRPLGRGRVALLAGGSFGEARLLALDDRGRILGYGFGAGSVQRISICPGSQIAAELVDRGGRRTRVAVRSLVSLRVLSSAGVPRSTSELVCADASGTTVYAGGIRFSGRQARGRAIVHRVSGSAVTTVVRRAAEEFALGPDAAYAWSRRRLLAISLADGSERTLLRMGRPTLIAPSPFGTRLAVHGFDDRLRIVDLVTGAVRSRQLRLAWMLAWLDPDRLLVRLSGTAVAFDSEFKKRRRYPFYRALHQAHVSGALYGTARYRLVRLELDTGRKRTVGLLPDRGIEDLAGVAEGPELSVPRRTPRARSSVRAALRCAARPAGAPPAARAAAWPG